MRRLPRTFLASLLTPALARATDAAAGPGLPVGASTAASLVLVLGLVTALLAWLARSEKAAPSATSDDRVDLWWGTAATVVAALYVGVQLVSFRFAEDDFELLAGARHGFYDGTRALRYLGSGVRLAIGSALGSKPFLYGTMNALALAAIVLSWRALLRTTGFSSARANLATAFAVLLAPGFGHVTRMMNGFDTLASIALVFASLTAFEKAARTPAEQPRRFIAQAAIGTWCIVAGDFHRFPLMGLVPLALAASLLVGGQTAPRLDRLRLPFIALVAWISPVTFWRAGDLGLTRPANDPIDAAQTRTAMLATLEGWLTDLSGFILFAIVLLFVAFSYRLSKGRREGLVTLPMREGLRWTALTVVLTAPFLFHNIYWQDYDLLAALFPASVLVAEFFVWASPGGWPGRLLAVLTALAFLPTVEDRRPVAAPVAETAYVAWLEAAATQARSMVADVPAKAHFTWASNCTDATKSEQTHEALVQLAIRSVNDAGLRWATGWRNVSVSYEVPEAMRARVPNTSTASAEALRFRMATCVDGPLVVTVERP